jgi:hypothetical protein
MASPHKLASPQGVLHLVPREARAILDSSHSAKKGINNFEGSHVLRHVRKKRQLQLPELHVDTIHASITHLFYGPPPPPTATGSGEEACGEEAYLYVMRRIYNIMNSYEPYAAGCELQNEPRLVEWLTSWRMYNDVVSALGVNPRLCLSVVAAAVASSDIARARAVRIRSTSATSSARPSAPSGDAPASSGSTSSARSRASSMRSTERERATLRVGLSCQRAVPIRLYSVTSLSAVLLRKGQSSIGILCFKYRPCRRRAALGVTRDTRQAGGAGGDPRRDPPGAGGAASRSRVRSGRALRSIEDGTVM